MSEYRSALLAAERRLEQLEADLATRAPVASPCERRVLPSRLVPLFFGVLLSTILLGLVGAAWRSFLPVSIIQLPEPPARRELEQPRGGLRWFDQHHWIEGGGPAFADVDADTREVLGLAWDRRVDADGLYAVALDRETLGLRWKAGPFAGVWPPGTVELHHLVVFRDRVIVTDARGGVHVLSARTGEVLLERTLSRAIESACVSEDGAPRLFFANDSYWRPSYPGDTGSGYFPWELNAAARMSFDPMTGKTGAAPRGLGCPLQPTYCSHYAHARPDLVDRCRDLYEAKEMPSFDPEFSAHEVWRSGDDRVTVGSSGQTPALVGWTKKDKKLRWHVAPISLGSYDSQRPSLSGIGDVYFAHLYRDLQNRLALAVFDLPTGTRHFDTEVPGSGVGSEIVSVTVDGADVFVGVDDELLVFDARSGDLRKRIDSL
jgi:hypothetical protein